MVNRAYLEVEDKCDLGPSVPLPALDGFPAVNWVGPPVVMSLQATYLDTPGLRLSGRGITLRYRTGGDDDGWHLKLPVSSGKRTEVRHPLGRSQRGKPPVPADLLRLVCAYVRDAGIGPVARVKTDRTVYRLYGRGDVALADVADDQVTGQALGAEVTVPTWREIEVELLDGEPDLLTAVGVKLRAAGARPAKTASKLARTLGDHSPSPAPRLLRAGRPRTAGAALHSYLAEHVAALMATDAGVREDLPDAVHQMRVATRRLRSTLATYRPLFDRASTDPVREELKWLGGILSGVRDTEVMQTRLLAGLDELSGELVLGPVRARVRRELRAQYRQGRQDMLAELHGGRYFRLLDNLDALVDAPPFTARAESDAKQVLLRLISREWTRLRDRHAATRSPATGVASDLAVHETRKAAKRARYAAEVVVPLAGAQAERYTRQMKKLQNELGGHQDSVVARQLLRTLGGQAYRAGENGFTFGLLHGLERLRGDEARVRYDRAWSKASQPRLRRWLH